jgi:hypothetical protein
LDSAAQPQRLLAVGGYTSAQRLVAVGDTAEEFAQWLLAVGDTANLDERNKTAATHPINKAIEGNKSNQHLGDFYTTSSHAYHSIKSDTKGNTIKSCMTSKPTSQGPTQQVYTRQSLKESLHAAMHRTHSKAIPITTNLS